MTSVTDVLKSGLRRQRVPWVLGVLGVVAALVAVGAWWASTPRPAPRPATTAGATTKPVAADGLARELLWNRIRAHIDIASRIGPMAAQKYAWSLDSLRKSSREVTEAIVTEFDRVPRQSYQLREALVFLVGELGEPAGVGLLRRLASSNERTEGRSPELEGRLMDPERSLRITAIGALMRHALRGSAAAKAALVELRGHPDRSTRVMAENVLASKFPEADDRRTPPRGEAPAQ